MAQRFVEPRSHGDEPLHALGIKHPPVGIDDAEATVVFHTEETEFDLLELLDRKRLDRRDVNPRDVRTHGWQCSTAPCVTSGSH